jgi:putative oxidoreductase
MTVAAMNLPMDWLRVLCGVWFLPHVFAKIRNRRAAAANTFLKAGFRPPEVFVLLAIAMELLAAFGLIFDVFSKLAATLASLVLLGAAYAVVKINGFNWRWQKQGPEYMIFWTAACAISVWGQP